MQQTKWKEGQAIATGRVSGAAAPTNNALMQGSPEQYVTETSHDASTPERIVIATSLARNALAQGKSVALACDPTMEAVLAGIGISYLAQARGGRNHQHEGNDAGYLQARDGRNLRHEGNDDGRLQARDGRNHRQDRDDASYPSHAQSVQLRLVSNASLQLQLDEELVVVPSAFDDDTVGFARRVLHGFATKTMAHCSKRRKGGCPSTCADACMRRMKLACASDDPSMPEVVHQYLRLGFAVGDRVRDMISEPRVAAFNDLARYVSGECEHVRQFVRFSRLSDGSFGASFSPRANAIPLVAHHFAERMGPERFFLVDPRHRMAAFHEPGQRSCNIVRLDSQLAEQLASRNDFAQDEIAVRILWQHFYSGTSLPGRGPDQRGYDLRAHWMPKRLWNGLSELDPLA